MTSGVLQETVLGSLLFLCFINNIYTLNMFPKKFDCADDTLIIDTEDDCIDLQRDQENLQQWENTWKCTLIHRSVNLLDSQEYY